MARLAESFWKHYACSAILFLAVAVSFARWLLFVASDPLHCHALVTQGQWLDSNALNWQPEGCMLHPYTKSDVATCLAHKRVVFVGDSVARNLFFALMHISDPSLPQSPPHDDQKHADYQETTPSDIEFSFIWDPFLNATRTHSLLKGTNRSERPSLLVMGSGLWYLRYQFSSGGLAAWEAKIEEVFNRTEQEFFDIAETLAFLPVEKLVPNKLTEDRASTMKPSDIDAMNADLKHRIYPSILSFDRFGLPSHAPRPPLSILLPLVFNDILQPSETEDGMHYGQSVMTTQANILLNRCCNDVLPKSAPFDKTCCRAYPSPSWLQLLLLTIFGGLGPLVLALRRREDLGSLLERNLPTAQQGMHLTVFGLAVVLLYIADRSHVFLKEQKQYNAFIFCAMSFAVLAVGALTIRRSDKEQGFLNRDQTDEWKGWMQLMILIYHYFGASKISGIYNPIRVLVASYFFMTGYGHCSYYLKKADFSFLRVVQVLTRLNLLTVALAYTMGTNYFDYYFSPLVSFWFLVIYITMFVGAKYNDKILFLLFKLALSSGLITSFMSRPILFQNLMALVKKYGNITWSPAEVAFRLNLDIWIVYIGMLLAICLVKFREFRVSEHPHYRKMHGSATALSFGSIVWYMYFQLSQESKFTYNVWHPYISSIPIIGFIVLRNATAVMRSSSSQAFAFIGTCSLETFIIQFHFWLSADTKGILLVIPGTSLRPLNFIISTVAFIWLSDRVSISTIALTEWICGSSKTPARARSVYEPVPDQDAVDMRNIESQPVSRSSDAGMVGPGPWADRLASGTAAPGFRMVDGVSLHVWKPGLKGRFLCAGIILWLLNLTWTKPRT